jgi:Fic-DOC domain mobile mystery protein B
MIDPLGPKDDAATELTEEEREGLIPSYITTRAELNEAEQENILEGRTWAFARKRGDPLHEAFLDRLHKHMYGNVWSWAGTHRKSFKGIGDVEAYRIPTELRNLLDNCRYWIEHGTHSPDEIAARFHHELTRIHCYPNGNGRHARLAADLLLVELGQEPFTWGTASIADASETRARYIASLHAADDHDIGPLLEFVRS